MVWEEKDGILSTELGGIDVRIDDGHVISERLNYRSGLRFPDPGMWKIDALRQISRELYRLNSLAVAELSRMEPPPYQPRVLYRK